MSLESNIVLIGMPGAGKSTAGVLLAKSLKRPFLDTDLHIQTQADRHLHELIAELGMERFLDWEAREIMALHVQGHVIATGGSVVYRPTAMAHLRERGVIVFIDVPVEDILARVSNITTRGIAMRPNSTLQALFDERLPLYRQYADLVVAAEGLTVEDAVTRIVRRLEEYDGRQ
jgi:shikimate kinase